MIPVTGINLTASVHINIFHYEVQHMQLTNQKMTGILSTRIHLD